MLGHPVLSYALTPAFRPNTWELDGSTYLYSAAQGSGATTYLGGFSGAFYIKPVYTGDQQYIYSQQFISGQWYLVYLDKAGYVHVVFANAASESYEIASLAPCIFDEWNFIIFALDASGDNYNCLAMNGGDPNDYIYYGAAFSEPGIDTSSVGVFDMCFVSPTGYGVLGSMAMVWIDPYGTTGFGEDNYYPQGFIVPDTGMPRNLGPNGNKTLLHQPPVWLHSAADKIHINGGYYSDFTKTGEFFDADPPTHYYS